jgi:replicative DNA helicase
MVSSTNQLYSKEAEMACLGSMILQKDIIPRIISILSSDDFFFEANRIIYKTILEMDSRGDDIDLLTLQDELSRKGMLDSVGGVSYLTEVYRAVESPSNVMTYAKIVKEKSYLRRLVEAAQNIIDDAYSGEKTPDEILENAERFFFSLEIEKGSKDFVHIKDVLVDTFERIETMLSRKSAITGISTGFRELDRFTAGFHNGEFIVVAARPSFGKTAFGINIASHIALKEQKTVAIFSLEMPAEQIAMRMLSSESRIPLSKISTGRLTKQEMNILAITVEKLANCNLYIDDTSYMSVYELRSKARRLYSQYGLDFVLVDYLQLLTAGRRRGESRQQEVAEISRVLKSIARDLNIPLLAISQVRRAAEQRVEQVPQLSDLRESGAIEQDADVVMFIHREDKIRQDIVEEENIAEIIIAKQRNGPTGSFKLAFIEEYTRFEDIAYFEEEV